ncbi:MAG: aminotransferase class V-fold PLP-dependent enzyme [Deltaproteobacteria bacterium]|nr:aminotransferase class V-fold PLP-dependent enzyme [Deltaproteobacteria bacterium]
MPKGGDATGQTAPELGRRRATVTRGTRSWHRSGVYALLWPLDPNVRFLNHGSFGACPRSVIAAQAEIVAQMEANPVRFFARELEPLLDSARERLSAFVAAAPEDIVFVPNATHAVATVLRSLDFEPGDELLLTNHGYPAVKNAAALVADRAGAEVVVAEVPFPLSDPTQVTEAIARSFTDRTKLLIVDHVTSPTGLVFPIRAICDAAGARGIDVLVDGAHALGMLDLDVPSTGATYYTANAHKWLCAPKGSAFLWARSDKRSGLRPLAPSHGATSTRKRSRFWLEFDWTGTFDPSAWLTVPAAIDHLGTMVPGGWPEIRARNRALALEARARLCAALAIEPPAPESMIGSLVSVPLPVPLSRGLEVDPVSSVGLDPLIDVLAARHHIEVPVFPWPRSPERLLRVALQLYNSDEDIAALVDALRSEGLVRS